MRIVELAVEFAPLAKAGGLGEVVTGLSSQLIRIGQKVEVIFPKYDFIDSRKLRNIKMEVPDFKCTEKRIAHANTMWSAEWEGVPLHLLEARHPAGYFHRGKIYGCEYDIARFLYFSRAALEYLKLKNQPIDVLHIHDWHVAIAALMVRDLFQLPIKSILLTIHNAAYQGKCATWDLDAIGLKGANYLTKEIMQDNDSIHSKNLNILKGGIIYSDAVNAVSPTYSKELLTSAIGHGLDPTFRKIKGKLSGILNGLELGLWDPAKDVHLAKGFKQEDSFESIFNAKAATREVLCKRFSLNQNKRPWIGAITRLVPQKGPELLEEALAQIVRLGGTFLLLGSSPTQKIQNHFEKLKQKYKDHSQVLLHFEYDDALAHQIYAALDFLVIPSLYEPCGLTQMIGMRYGTVPIARATGGHKDTIFDCENPQVPFGQCNGFLFPNFTNISLIKALERAIKTFRHAPEMIHALIQHGMKMDWSWEKPTEEYLQLFEKITKGNVLIRGALEAPQLSI